MVKRAGVIVAALAATIVLLSSGAAMAFSPPSGGSGGRRGGGAGGGGSNGTHKTGVVRTCDIYGDASGFGLDCLGGSGGGESIAQILDGSPLPDCWDVPFTAEQLAQLDPADLVKHDFFTHTCLFGISKDLVLSPDGVSFTYSTKPLPKNAPTCSSPVKKGQNEKKCRQVLDTHQQELVDTEGSNGQIPYPFAVPLPTITQVRVNEQFAFHNTPPAGYDSATVVGPIDAGGVEMRAVMTSFTVYPLGDGTAPLACPDLGTTVVHAGDTPQTVPNACWYSYQNSSADQPGQQYDVRVQAHWQIQTNAGAGWTVFNQFDKWSYLALTVNEIQSLVIN